MTQKQGRLITIEGIEGAGKSSASTEVADYLAELDVSATTTREPGGTLLGERVRGLLLDDKKLDVTPEAELLLLFACRAQHLHEVIYPALARGDWVICDRFTDASFAYQGGGRGIGVERIEALEQWLQADFRPDLVIILDVAPDVGLKRIKESRGGALDRIEQEALDFFERVRNSYLSRAQEMPERYHIINAAHGQEKVKQQLRSVLYEFWRACNE